MIRLKLGAALIFRLETNTRWGREKRRFSPLNEIGNDLTGLPSNHRAARGSRGFLRPTKHPGSKVKSGATPTGEDGRFSSSMSSSPSGAVPAVYYTNTDVAATTVHIHGGTATGHPLYIDPAPSIHTHTYVETCALAAGRGATGMASRCLQHIHASCPEGRSRRARQTRYTQHSGASRSADERGASDAPYTLTRTHDTGARAHTHTYTGTPIRLTCASRGNPTSVRLPAR
jgi:hypothetical protein